MQFGKKINAAEITIVNDTLVILDIWNLLFAHIK